MGFLAKPTAFLELNSLRLYGNGKWICSPVMCLLLERDLILTPKRHFAQNLRRHIYVWFLNYFRTGPEWIWEQQLQIRFGGDSMIDSHVAPIRVQECARTIYLCSDIWNVFESPESVRTPRPCPLVWTHLDHVLCFEHAAPLRLSCSMWRWCASSPAGRLQQEKYRGGANVTTR